METESIVDGLETVLAKRTGSRLSHLQKLILRKVWQGLKYREIAEDAGYTEGHVKDVGSDLWKLLSKVFGAKITKSNCKAVVKRYLQSAGIYKSDQYKSDQHKSEQFKSEQHKLEQTIIHPEIINSLPTYDSNLTNRFSSPSHRSSGNFLGRSTSIEQLQQFVEQGYRVIVIQGEGGLGKTTLAQHYLYNQGYEIVLELLMAKECQHITPAERIVEEWLRQDFGIEPGLEFGVSLGRLKRQLEGRRVGILIDNLEPALDADGHFIAAHRRYLELLRVLSDTRVQSVTLITSRDRLCGADANLVHYRLPGLSIATWFDFFEQRHLSIQADILPQMHRAYGGNAKAMGILAGVIEADFDRDMQAYWQHYQTALLAEPDLHHLVLNQIARLQQLDPLAYRLFCRLGCYRYQDVATISIAGIKAMLWDVPEAAQRQVINSLKYRSLLEFHKGEYWLHPMLREAAISALRNQADWELSHRHAADFWSESVTTISTKQDALSALEAYHHYVEINDFENAAAVILKSRHNQWRQYLPLGSTLYRMGFVQTVLSAIDRILPELKSDKNLGELHNILGDLRWISGEVARAIECQQQTISLATQALQKLNSQSDIAIDSQIYFHIRSQTQHELYYFKMLEVDASLSLGLYHIDLWELDVATTHFRNVIASAANTAHKRWAEKAEICLALVLSYQDAWQESLALTEAITQVIDRQLTHCPEQIGSLAYFLPILGQVYINLSAHNSEFSHQAQALYEQALQSAVAGEYPQIKARSLHGLAQLARLQGDLETAVTSHQKAISLLESIGAICDLAEAHVQLGLTYQTLSSDRQQIAQQSERAKYLFTGINAPKQLQRLNNLFG